MPRKRVQHTIYLDAEQDRRLRELHGRTRVPMAIYIRDGVTQALNAADTAAEQAEAAARADQQLAGASR